MSWKRYAHRQAGLRVWIMRTKDGWYPVNPSPKCKPEDHGRLNDHVMSIEDAAGNTIWKRPIQ